MQLQAAAEEQQQSLSAPDATETPDAAAPTTGSPGTADAASQPVEEASGQYAAPAQACQAAAAEQADASLQPLRLSSSANASTAAELYPVQKGHDSRSTAPAEEAPGAVRSEATASGIIGADAHPEDEPDSAPATVSRPISSKNSFRRRQRNDTKTAAASAIDCDAAPELDESRPLTRCQPANTAKKLRSGRSNMQGVTPLACTKHICSAPIVEQPQPGACREGGKAQQGLHASAASVDEAHETAGDATISSAAKSEEAAAASDTAAVSEAAAASTALQPRRSGRSTAAAIPRAIRAAGHLTAAQTAATEAACLPEALSLPRAATAALAETESRAPRIQLGCSKCRYAARGCVKCRRNMASNKTNSATRLQAAGSCAAKQSASAADTQQIDKHHSPAVDGSRAARAAHRAALKAASPPTSQAQSDNQDIDAEPLPIKPMPPSLLQRKPQSIAERVAGIKQQVTLPTPPAGAVVVDLPLNGPSSSAALQGAAMGATDQVSAAAAKHAPASTQQIACHQQPISDGNLPEGADQAAAEAAKIDGTVAPGTVRRSTRHQQPAQEALLPEAAHQADVDTVQDGFIEARRSGRTRKQALLQYESLTKAQGSRSPLDNASMPQLMQHKAGIASASARSTKRTAAMSGVISDSEDDISCAAAASAPPSKAAAKKKQCMRPSRSTLPPIQEADKPQDPQPDLDLDPEFVKHRVHTSSTVAEGLDGLTPAGKRKKQQKRQAPAKAITPDGQNVAASPEHAQPDNHIGLLLAAAKLADADEPLQCESAVPNAKVCIPCQSYTLRT